MEQSPFFLSFFFLSFLTSVIRFRYQRHRCPQQRVGNLVNSVPKYLEGRPKKLDKATNLSAGKSLNDDTIDRPIAEEDDVSISDAETQDENNSL